MKGAAAVNRRMRIHLIYKISRMRILQPIAEYLPVKINFCKTLYCLSFSIFLLYSFICFPKNLFSEEQPGIIIEQGAVPARRILKSRNQDKAEKKSDEKLELEGVIMWDYDQCNGIHIGRGRAEYRVVHETELRRAHIDLKSTIDKEWQAELQVSFEDEDETPKVEDAFISFTGWEYITLTVGQTKEPFGLEELTSSSNISTIERSMATSAFAPGCNLGLGISGGQGPFIWALGVYKAADRKNRIDTYALTGRLGFAPWELKKRVLYFGISGSVRDFSGETYKIEESAEVHTAEKIVKSAETSADDVRLLGVEFAWAMGPFSLQAEHMTAFIKAVIGEDAVYMGYYIQGNLFLTGEYRPYKNGGFKRIKPASKYGALELISRFSSLDAEDNDSGTRAENLTLGLNYYINKRIRLMNNYIKTVLIDGVSDIKGGAEAISLRIQYDF